MASATLDAKLRLDSAQFTGGLDKALRTSKVFLGKMSSAFGSIKTVLTGGIAGIAIADIFGTAADREEMVLSLAAVAGGMEAATQQFERLKTLALKPGLDLKSAVTGSERLQAVGYTAEEAEKALEELGNAVAKTGGRGPQLEAVVTALAKMTDEGQITSKGLKTLFVEMPGFATQMKKAFGTDSVDAIVKMNLSAREFFSTMIAGMAGTTRVAENMRDSADTFAETIDNLKAQAGTTIGPGLQALMKGLEYSLSGLEDLQHFLQTGEFVDVAKKRAAESKKTTDQELAESKKRIEARKEEDRIRAEAIAKYKQDAHAKLLGIGMETMSLEAQDKILGEQEKSMRSLLTITEEISAAIESGDREAEAALTDEARAVADVRNKRQQVRGQIHDQNSAMEESKRALQEELELAELLSLGAKKNADIKEREIAIRREALQIQKELKVSESQALQIARERDKLNERARYINEQARRAGLTHAERRAEDRAERAEARHLRAADKRLERHERLQDQQKTDRIRDIKTGQGFRGLDQMKKDALRDVGAKEKKQTGTSGIIGAIREGNGSLRNIDSTLSGLVTF